MATDHTVDISRAFIAALEAPAETVSTRAFNVGQTAHNYRIRDLADVVADVIPGCKIEFAEGAGPDKRSYRVSFEKVSRRLPSFKPQWDARRGAQQLYEAYKSTGLTLHRILKGLVTSASATSKSCCRIELSTQTTVYAQPPRGRRPMTPKLVSIAYCGAGDDVPSGTYSDLPRAARLGRRLFGFFRTLKTCRIGRLCRTEIS